jgi:hypothetical protein
MDEKLIALRKRYRAFGRGLLEFRHPANRSILAFIRRWQKVDEGVHPEFAIGDFLTRRRFRTRRECSGSSNIAAGGGSRWRWRFFSASSQITATHGGTRCRRSMITASKYGDAPLRLRSRYHRTPYWMRASGICRPRRPSGFAPTSRWRV